MEENNLENPEWMRQRRESRMEEDSLEKQAYDAKVFSKRRQKRSRNDEVRRAVEARERERRENGKR